MIRLVYTKLHIKYHVLGGEAAYIVRNLQDHEKQQSSGRLAAVRHQPTNNATLARMCSLKHLVSIRRMLLLFNNA